MKENIDRKQIEYFVKILENSRENMIQNAHSSAMQKDKYIFSVKTFDLVIRNLKLLLDKPDSAFNLNYKPEWLFYIKE